MAIAFRLWLILEYTFFVTANCRLKCEGLESKKQCPISNSAVDVVQTLQSVQQQAHDQLSNALHDVAMAGFSFDTHHPEQRVESLVQSCLTNAHQHPELPSSAAGAFVCFSINRC